MYKKLTGIALLGVFAVMLIPSSLSGAESVDETFYGTATIVSNDAGGNEIFSQIVHNAITDQGEEFLLDAVFSDGTEPSADNASIGTICITDSATGIASENITAQAFDGSNTIDNTASINACKETPGAATTASGVATIGPLEFECGGVNCADNTTIAAIGICQNDASTDTRNGCANTLFASVDVTDVTLNAGETANITYKFDISSDGS